jgi:hypothetical protein
METWKKSQGEKRFNDEKNEIHKSVSYSVSRCAHLMFIGSIPPSLSRQRLVQVEDRQADGGERGMLRNVERFVS